MTPGGEQSANNHRKIPPKYSWPPGALLTWGEYNRIMSVSQAESMVAAAPTVVPLPGLPPFKETLAEIAASRGPLVSEINVSTRDIFIDHPQIVDALCELLGQGNYIQVAAALVGLPYHTLTAWKRQAQAAYEVPVDQELTAMEAAYIALDLRIKHAKSAAEANLVAVITIAARRDMDWRAAMEFLARRYPERWGKQRSELELKGNVTIESLVRTLVQPHDASSDAQPPSLPDGPELTQ